MTLRDTGLIPPRRAARRDPDTLGGVAPHSAAPRLDLDTILADPGIRIVVCCGAGGVGKTTTAAAVGLRAAERHGRRTVVLTIDPARRLAQSLGLTELDNTPRQVKGIDGGESGGELHAMMLDMKRTFDEVVLAHTDPQRAAEIFANPFYQAMSSTFSGTQEYMAMEKLGQRHQLAEYDLIVVDTPPSRSALDFLDAPARLSSFLDGRLIRLLSAPARAGGRAYLRVVRAGMNSFTSVVTRVLGTELLADLQTFVAALDSMFGGFRERAEHTYALLAAPETRFVVVATPDADALREASYFIERLAADGMHLSGIVVNRLHSSAAAELTAAQSRAAAGKLRRKRNHALTRNLLELHADRMTIINAETRLVDRFEATHPRVRRADVPAITGDVHDLAGLRIVGGALAATTAHH
jgi:anion-transporting  ArsA/GET3 family ATPase